MPIEDAAKLVAERLAREHRDRIDFAPLDPDRRGDLIFAYAVQDALVSIYRADGESEVSGYKVGLTTKKMQAFCGVDTPIAGSILSSRTHHAPHDIDSAAFCRLGLEMELAIRISRDVPHDAELDATRIRGFIDAVSAAFELIDDRNADYATLDAASIAADNSWNAGIVLGPVTAVTDDLALLDRSGVLECDGRVIDSGVTQDAGGDPLDIVVWLADLLRGRGKSLKAGQWVMTGSLIATVFPKPGENYRFTIEGLAAVDLAVG